MIRAVTQGKDGPLLVFGITAENVKRLQDGQPISVDIGQLIRHAQDERGRLEPGTLTLVLLYGETHRTLVDEMAAAGVSLPDSAAAEADAIDRTL